MALSNTATPIYYGQFRDAVIRGEIPICKEIEMLFFSNVKFIISPPSSNSAIDQLLF